MLTALWYYLSCQYGDAISASDLIFSVGFLIYVAIANAVCFDSNKLQFTQRQQQHIEFEPMGKHSLGKGQFITQKSFIIYFITFKILGFLVPLLIMVFGPSNLAATMIPSFFVIVAQAVAEPSTAKFHDVPRILVPIGYQSYRLFGPLSAWASGARSTWETISNDTNNTFNLILSWSNLILCAWNLFGFLLLRVVPLYFDKTDSPTPEFAYTLVPLPKKKHL